VSAQVLMPLRSCIDETIDALLRRSKTSRLSFKGLGDKRSEKILEILTHLSPGLAPDVGRAIANQLAAEVITLSNNKQSLLDRQKLLAILLSSSHALKGFLEAID
jgi:hypothetical protein